MFDKMEKLVNFILIVSLGLMVILIFSQVIARFVFNRPLSWTEELSRHLMIWMAFIATAIAYRHGAHLSIDLLAQRLAGKKRVLLELFFLIIIIFFLSYMIKYGIELTQKTFRQTSSALQYPMSYVYLSIPSSGILMIVFTIEKFIDTVKNGIEEHNRRL